MRISLYNHEIFDTSKNAFIEDIEAFLGTLETTYESNIQYQKIDLDINVKLNLDQEYQYNIIGNYARIDNDDKVFYYFVMQADWVSSKCVMLTLSMDTINTYPEWVTDLSNKTTVIREHRNRYQETKNVYSQTTKLYKADGTVDSDMEFTVPLQKSMFAVDIELTTLNINGIGYSCTINSTEVKKISHSGGWNLIVNVHIKAPVASIYSVQCSVTYITTRLLRLIDTTEEGITPILYNIPYDKEVVKDNDSDLKWYLIYKTDVDTANTVRCFICASEKITCNLSKKDNAISASDLEYNKYYTLENMSGDGYAYVSFTLDDGTVIKYVLTAFEYMFVKLNDNLIQIYKNNETRAVNWSFANFATTQYMELTYGKVTELRAYNYIPTGTNTSHNTYPITIKSGNVTIQSIADLDRTDSKLIKIIELPYAPFTCDIVDGIYQFDDSKYLFSDNLIELKDLNSTFENTFEIEHNIIGDQCYLARRPTITEGANSYFESKLYNSSYNYWKFVYDSFNYVFPREYLEPLNNLTGLHVTFKPTNTINSKFLFSFDTDLQNTTQDYDNIVPISRNNEIALYNSEYINYIKNGYNYDVKSKNIQTAQNWIGVTANIVGAVASFVSGAVTGGIGIAAGVMFATNAVTSITSAISNTISAEQAIQQKLDNYRNQATTISGTDDIDLLNYYADDNKAKLIEYVPSNNMHHHLFDLFRLTGYATNLRKIPELNTRYWYNFIQCEADFKGATKYSTYSDDIKARLKIGVTIYHNHDDQWDFDQKYENPEA